MIRLISCDSLGRGHGELETVSIIGSLPPLETPEIASAASGVTAATLCKKLVKPLAILISPKLLILRQK